MENLKQIGMRVREVRDQANLTEEQMASALGVSTKEYKGYEAGTDEAPFSFYYRVAERFGIDLSSIISGISSNLSFYTITRNGEGFSLARRPGFSYLHQAIHMKDREGEPFIITAPYGGENPEMKFSTHSGQEFILVLEGSLRVMLKDKLETLNVGDTMYFDGRYPHALAAVGGTACKFLSIVMHKDVEDVAPDRFATDLPEEQEAPAVDSTKLLYQEYMTETWAADGSLTKVDFNVPENFNFAFDVLDRIAAREPEKLAMRWVSNEKVCRDFTFRDISENSSRSANLFHSLGIRKGDRVMLIVRRHYQFWYLVNALHKLGAVVIPAPVQLLGHDIEYRINKAKVKCVVCTAGDGVCDAVDSVADKTPSLQWKLTVNGERDGWMNYDAMYGNFSPVFARPENLKSTDPMLIFFSSGTSGYPKMVEHDYSYPLGHVMTARHWHKVDPKGIHFTVADTGWGKAVWGKLYGQWLCEAAVFTFDFDRFHAADMLPMFKQYGITTFCAPPTIFRFLVKEDLSQYDFSTLQHVTTAGEAMPPEVSESFARVSGLVPHEGFGQTETAMSIGTFANIKPKSGSMGKPNPQYEVVLLDPDGKPVAMGDTGEICIKAEQEGHPAGLFTQYVDNVEDTLKTWHDGYYHTGDQAWMDEDGYFWYVGRADDIIKTSGYRVGPFEVESVIMELPYVLECAVTGVPDPVRGKVVKASIVLVKGKEGSEELKKEIQEYVKTHTAPYKYPRIVEFMKELPKTVNGKIRRVALREADTKK